MSDSDFSDGDYDAGARSRHLDDFDSEFPRKGSQKVQNQHFDEAFDVSDEDTSPAPPARSKPVDPQPSAGMYDNHRSPDYGDEDDDAGYGDSRRGGRGLHDEEDEEDEDEEDDEEEEEDEDEDDDDVGMNPRGSHSQGSSGKGGMGNTSMGSEGMLEDDGGPPETLESLWAHIKSFEPAQVDLEAHIHPFIPEYMPAVGDIDAFLKVPRPDDKTDNLGLVSVDEPATKQSDPAVMDLQLRALTKKSGVQAAVVRSIENADKNPRAVATWIENISALHSAKPKVQVQYSRPMPDVETLMQTWPPEFEELLSHVALPDAEVNLEVDELARVACALLDIPVYSKLIESLHLLFSLYADFRANQHFQNQ
jgi:intraflagellar transport protein 46